MKWKEYPQNIKVRLITSFFNRAISSAVMPFMALFFAQHKGAVWAGVFLGMNVFIGFFSNLIGGYMSDRVRRKSMLIVTSSISALLFGLMTISLIPNEKWIGLFAVSYMAFMVSSSLGRPAMQAIIIDSTTADNRKAIYAIDYWLINLSIAIGTALGGLFYVHHQLLLFIILTCVSASLPIAFALWLQDTSTKQAVKKHQNPIFDLAASYKVALQDKPFVMAVVGSMCIFAAEFSLNSYIGVRLAEEFSPVYIGEFELGGVRMLSLLNIENTMLVVLLTFVVTKITDRYDKKKMLLVGLIFYGIGYTVLTSANIWYVLILFNFIGTIGELMYSPIANAEKANMMPEDKRGSYSAFSGTSFSGADLLARTTIILGAFLAPSMMSVYIGIILLIGTFLLYGGLFVFQRENQNGKWKMRKSINP
ncbi:MFS transporter [Mesobacillus maritimus]|uniref:MDR family MFS transporter n=1 Tax=Mesobacillus maritimus TaxID=1643336 RepID=UPI00203F396C|nr:MFS transporter [Mesobacillus maritimus]MCM3585577.1 MFS transporter [Mesobacillus maritimus]